MSGDDLLQMPRHHAGRPGPVALAAAVGPDGTEFILAFDKGTASEFDTLLVTDWMAQRPPEVLAKNFRVPAETLRRIPTHDPWIFQGAAPCPLAPTGRRRTWTTRLSR